MSREGNKDGQVELESSRKDKRKLKVHKIKVNKVAFALILFVLPFITFLSVQIMNRGGVTSGLKWVLSNPKEAIFNYIIIFAILNVFLFILKGNLFLTFSIIISVFLSVLAYISYVKTELRGEPLTLLDFRLAGEALNISEALDSSIYTPVILLTVISVLLLSFVLVFVKANVSNPIRFVVAGISLAVLLFGYTSNINILGKIGVVIPADVSWNHDQNGFVLATLVDTKFLKIPKPKDYSKENIKKIYDNMVQNQEGLNENNEEKPNVVFVMSEAFWDPKFANELKLSEDPIPHFNRLSKENISGKIEVPGVGGGTANTEYEVLTGLTKNFIKNYSTPYNPYNTYINRPINSMASIFSKEGYETAALHTYQSWFYRRNVVYKQLGFDRYLSLETLGNNPVIEGKFAADSEMNQLIFNEIKRTDKPNFIYAITMQGHGPYSDMPVKSNKIKVENNVSDTSKTIIENYFNNQAMIDEELNNLVKSFEKLDEPTILVYFGDHVPPLGAEVFKEVGFDIYGPNGLSTPLLVWSNEKKLRGKVDMNANMLGTYVLNEVGIKSDLFMSELFTVSEEHPHIDLNKDEDSFKAFEMLQYDIMHGKQYFYEFAGRPQVNSDYMIGYPMEIKQVMAQEFKDNYVLDVTGENLGWMSSIMLNDKEFPILVKDGKRATFFVPKDEIDPKDSLKFVVKMKDSRGKTITNSNSLSYGNIGEALQNFETNKGNLWKEKAILDGDKEWEFFAGLSGFNIVRVNLNLKEIPYFVEKGGLALNDKNADLMDMGNQSDIYNGYLYLTILDKDSGWKGNVTTNDIKNYFNKYPYTLNLSK